ncbi:MAG: glycine cleavage system aminomethyltransferase GcvT [Christensenellales bacterium]
MKKTPLYEDHLKLNGKIIEFGGWALPVQYKGIMEEHQQVRNYAGLFDVSHMGEITVKGRDAEGFLQKMVTNDISAAKDFQIVYSPVCYPNGGVVDDLLVYRFHREFYLLVVNASNTDKDFEWLSQHVFGDVSVENVSDSYAQLALQGPKAQKILQKMSNSSLDEIRFYHFLPDVKINGLSMIVSRTGYTGEDGFELYLPPEHASAIWNAILSAGSEEGLMPIGLGARDTLRFEAALPLYGHEISAEISPLEAGLGKFVKLNKEDFIGKEALGEQSRAGLHRKLAGFEMTQPGIPRGGYEVWAKGSQIGFVTTGSYAPTLQKSIGMALVSAQFAEAGSLFEIIIRGKPVQAKVVPMFFYSKKYKNN